MRLNLSDVRVLPELHDVEHLADVPAGTMQNNPIRNMFDFLVKNYCRCCCCCFCSLTLPLPLPRVSHEVSYTYSTGTERLSCSHMFIAL